jgi:hypothetical protein
MTKGLDEAFIVQQRRLVTVLIGTQHIDTAISSD